MEEIIMGFGEDLRLRLSGRDLRLRLSGQLALREDLRLLRLSWQMRGDQQIGGWPGSGVIIYLIFPSPTKPSLTPGPLRTLPA